MRGTAPVVRLHERGPGPPGDRRAGTGGHRARPDAPEPARRTGPAGPAAGSAAPARPRQQLSISPDAGRDPVPVICETRHSAAGRGPAQSADNRCFPERRPPAVFRPAAGPRVRVTLDSRRRNVPPAPLLHRPPRADKGVRHRGHLRLRPLLHRHRPLQLPHRRPHARRPDVRRSPQEGRSPRADGLGTRRTVRLARRHRPRPRHAQGRAPRPGGPLPPHRRRGERGRRGGADPHDQAAAAARRRDRDGPRDRLRRVDRADPAPPPLPAVPRQRHDALRLRPDRRPAPGEDLLLGRRRLRRRRGRRRRGPDQARRHRPEVPLPHRRRADAARPGHRPLHRRPDAGEREGLAHRGRDQRGPAGDLAA